MIKIFTKLPVLLVAIFVFSMFLVDSFNIFTNFDFRYQSEISFIVLSFGVLLVAIGGYTFRKLRTTVNPMTPELTRVLVKDGIFRLSRNPMYIGFFAWLLACALFIGNIANFAFFPLYVFLVNKMYIIPEEEALGKLFGSEFEEYKNKVGRWF